MADDNSKKLCFVIGPINPAAPPPLIATSSDVPNLKMGEIYGLSPSSSNSILGKLLDTVPKREEDET